MALRLFLIARKCSLRNVFRVRTGLDRSGHPPGGDATDDIAAPARGPELERTSIGLGKKVLVVDDDDDVGDALRLYLLKNEREISVVRSGDAAIDWLRGAVPDLVILDARMPGMSGYEVCRWMRANATTEWTPVIFLTACDGTRERVEAAEAGSDVFVVKSSAYSRLSKAVDRLLGDAPRSQRLPKRSARAEPA
jgi:CheY-like chemotaxis protein